MKNFYFAFIILFFCAQNAIASDTLQSLKNRELEILNMLKNPAEKTVNEKKKSQEKEITQKLTTDKKVKKQPVAGYIKENAKVEKENLQQVELKNDFPNLNENIKKADLILKESKLENLKNSRKTINKQLYTISYDYFDEISPTDSFVYVANDVTLHTLPSLSSKLIYLVKANTKLKLDKNHGAWYRVKSADDKYGWILGDMLYFGTQNEDSTLKIRGKGF